MVFLWSYKKIQIQYLFIENNKHFCKQSLFQYFWNFQNFEKFKLSKKFFKNIMFVLAVKSFFERKHYLANLISQQISHQNRQSR